MRQLSSLGKTRGPAGTQKDSRADPGIHQGTFRRLFVGSHEGVVRWMWSIFIPVEKVNFLENNENASFNNVCDMPLENVHRTYADSDGSDQPAHSHCLIRI